MIFGGNLTKLDETTKSLMTNKELLDIDQNSFQSIPLPIAQKDGQPVPWRGWVAHARDSRHKTYTYLAVFNLSDDQGIWDIPWTNFQLPDKPRPVYDLFGHEHIPMATSLHVQIPSHGAAVFRLE
jgi:hypothetical protein